MPTRYESALWKARFAVVEHDRDCVVTEWNGGAERIFGYTRQEAISRRIDALFLSAADAEAWRQLHDDDSGVRRTFRCKRNDGCTVSCEWSHEPVLDEQGQVCSMLCFGQDVTARVLAKEELERKEVLLRAVIDNVAIALGAFDRQGIITLQDGAGVKAAGMTPGQLVGMNIFDLYTEPTVVQAMRKAFAGEPTHLRNEAHGGAWETWYVPTRDERGEVSGVLSVTLNVSEAKRREEELRAKLAVIERQQTVIQELSTPIIEVWDKVLTVPMMGVVDSARTVKLMESLLHAVVEKQARYAILDFTGVDAMDTQTASYLIGLICAIRLLGAEGIITGIQPGVAQTVVTLGLDLSNILTRGNLRAGLKYCMQQEQRALETSEPTVNGRKKPAR
jgi:rsbT co-antagonist protein RsbR